MVLTSHTCLVDMPPGGSLSSSSGLPTPPAPPPTLLHHQLPTVGPPSELPPTIVPWCPLDVILKVGAPPSLQGVAHEVVLALPATSRSLFPGFTIRPLGDGPLLVYLAAAEPQGLLNTLGAFFPTAEVPAADLLDGGEDEDA